MCGGGEGRAKCDTRPLERDRGGGGLNKTKFLIERYFFEIFKIFELSTHAKAIIKSFFKITQLTNFLMPF